MEFLVASDSHGNFNKLYNMVMDNGNINEIFFLGDGARDIEDVISLFPSKKIYYVSGNCDLMSLRPSWDIKKMRQGKILYTHGDVFGVKTGLSKLVLAAKKEGADIALFGHTHIKFFEEREGVFLINPGSISKGEYAIVSIDSNKPKVAFCEV